MTFVACNLGCVGARCPDVWLSTAFSFLCCSGLWAHAYRETGAQCLWCLLHFLSLAQRGFVGSDGQTWTISSPQGSLWMVRGKHRSSSKIPYQNKLFLHCLSVVGVGTQIMVHFLDPQNMAHGTWKMLQSLMIRTNACLIYQPPQMFIFGKGTFGLDNQDVAPWHSQGSWQANHKPPHGLSGNQRRCPNNVATAAALNINERKHKCSQRRTTWGSLVPLSSA